MQQEYRSGTNKLLQLARVVEDQWRREVHRLTDGRVLDVVLSE
jgi:hypothetical protein